MAINDFWDFERSSIIEDIKRLQLSNGCLDFNKHKSFAELHSRTKKKAPLGKFNVESPETIEKDVMCGLGGTA